jgi:hypothetical protein
LGAALIIDNGELATFFGEVWQWDNGTIAGQTYC